MKVALEPEGLSMMQSDAAFLDHVAALEGWLDPFTAARTVDLLNFQEKLGLHGHLYEIGVYWGKYFSILARSAAKSGDRAIGIDVFMYNTKSQLEERFALTDALISIDARSAHSFVASNSADLSEDEICNILGGKARFVSIDGSHDHDEVFWDLTVAEKNLAPYGIIAADDFLNGTCIGTNEAINRFLIQNQNVAPIAYCAGKLFISRPAWAKKYKDELERCVMDDMIFDKSRWFQENIKNNTRFNVETKFHGRPTLMFA